MSTAPTDNSATHTTPLMRQYTAIKQQNPDTILLYRMGDFYELFNDDARVASRVLGLTLTSRNHGGTDNTPLAGFPYHAIDRYATRLVKAGYKIAVCEQTEDPKLAKGIVKRDIVEIISAGTATEESYIDEKSNNYIAAIAPGDAVVGLGVCDLSTGEFFVEEIATSLLDEELMRLDPRELLVADINETPLLEHLRGLLRSVTISHYDAWKFSPESGGADLREHLQVHSLSGVGLDRYTVGVGAAGALLSYLKSQKKNDLRHITAIVPRSVSQFAELDAASIRNLELLRPIHSEDSEGTLLWVMDRTSTAMGARLLRRWITHPLINVKDINDRLDCVAWFKKDLFVRGEVELLLKQIGDIERLIGRITLERANARDCTALKNSLVTFPQLYKVLQNSPPKLVETAIKALCGFEDLVARIGATLIENPPLSVREGGLIRSGVSADLDTIKDAMVNGKQWIASLQESERVRTGIGSLKVGFNKVFGYYIEISNANKSAAPDNYIRKQTLSSGERFITPELKEMEGKILGAEERLIALEYELFVALRSEIARFCEKIQRAADTIALLDLFSSLAALAADAFYTRPELTDTTDTFIKDGRHPVVERMHPTEQFVPNDTTMSGADAQILLITGPNMAGKSTYLRQNALIALMAQMGSFVPAESARIGLVDKFFTRVGASDRLARGQSTFLVEMTEVANILNTATNRSLVLLDEVGRGTSTFDGVSIAWAVAEYLHETPARAARTLFATHYHELAELALLFPRIKNLHVRVKEWNDKIIFIRKIHEGACDHSFGIQVARLAGVPKPVIIRAREILSNLESMALTPDQKPSLARHLGDSTRLPQLQTDLFESHLSTIDLHDHEVFKALESLDLNSLTPLAALNMLSELKKKARE